MVQPLGFSAVDAKRARGPVRLAVSFERVVTRMTIEGDPDRLTVTDESGCSIIKARLEEGAITAEIDGIRYLAPFVAAGATIFIRLGALETRFDVGLAVETGMAGRAAAFEPAWSVTAPMPGVLAEIRVAEGSTVEANEIVAVLESMKLFVDLKSPAAGRVAQLAAAKGQTLSAGDLVIAIEPIVATGA
jgi:3-methylcrotonyl-CoA carboxylase alpha subunit